MTVCCAVGYTASYNWQYIRTRLVFRAVGTYEDVRVRVEKLSKSAAVATLAKAHLMTNESDDRSPLCLAFESGRSHLCIICKVEKERLSPTTPASERITLH